MSPTAADFDPVISGPELRGRDRAAAYKLFAQGIVSYLRESGAVPRVHGNGFIQVDMNETERMHVWHPRVPRQAVPTPIHDHVFSFESHVLIGKLVNQNYIFMPRGSQAGGPEYQIFEARMDRGDNTTLQPTGTYGSLIAYVPLVLGPGDIYTMHKRQFHESIATCRALTIITKAGPTLAQDPIGPAPRILVPAGLGPDNAFNRHAFPADTLWGIIEEVIA